MLRNQLCADSSFYKSNHFSVCLVVFVKFLDHCESTTVYILKMATVAFLAVFKHFYFRLLYLSVVSRIRRREANRRNKT